MSRSICALELLALMILLEATALVTPPLHVPVGAQRIALDMKPPVIQEHNMAPSFGDLISLGFTDVGTDLNPNTLDNLTEQSLVLNWVRSAHMAGLRVFASIGSNSSVNQRVQMAVALSFDYVELDEFLSGHMLKEEDFQSLLIGINTLYSMPILVTEYDHSAFQAAVHFAQRHPGIVVASDEYQQLSSLADVARIGHLAGVGVAAWIIFIPDPSHQWDAYVNLRSWMLEAITLGLNIYFYAVQSDTGWMSKWPLLQDLLRMRQFSLFVAATKRTMFATLLALSVWPAYSLVLQTIKPRKRPKQRRKRREVVQLTNGL